jgi:hypothetical protein
VCYWKSSDGKRPHAIAIGEWVNMLKRFGVNLIKTDCSSWTVEGQENISIPKIRPSLRMVTGIGVMCTSYLTCWPLIGLFGWLALELREPLIVSIGSPAAYIFSHFLFLAGAFIAGSEGVSYARQLVRWLVQTTFLRQKRGSPSPAPSESTYSVITPDKSGKAPDVVQKT